jgi:hypothetical protein
MDDNVGGTVSRKHPTAKAWVQTQASPCQVGDVESGNGIGDESTTSVLPRQYYFTKALHPFLSIATLNNISNWYQR